jgi:hypothetical protein
MLAQSRVASAGAHSPVIAWLALGLLGACVPPSTTPPVTAEGASARDRRAASLDLTIATDRSSYAREDDIVLTATLHNHGGRAIALAHPDYWGVSEISVTDASGRHVAPESTKTKRSPIEAVMTIPPGASRQHAFRGMTFYGCCSAESFRGRLAPGQYRIIVTFTNPPVRVTPPEGTSAWSGTLTSAPASIEVR